MSSTRLRRPRGGRFSTSSTLETGQTLFELCTRLTMKHELGLSRQAISQHLEVLEAAGLVSSRREGRYKFQYLDTTPLKGIVQRWSLED